MDSGLRFAAADVAHFVVTLESVHKLDVLLEPAVE